MIGITVREQGATPHILKRLFNRVAKECWHAMGTHWHARHRPKHFTHAGAKEYGYDPREGEAMASSHGSSLALGAGASYGERWGRKKFYRTYTGRKLSRFGHTYPLVWSGASRTLTQIRDVRSTRNGARVVLHASKLNFRKGKLGRGKTMREEMTTVSPRERDELAGVWDKAFQERITAAEDQSVVYILYGR